MAKKRTETPLMKQHREIKSKYPDAILLFRVGDFYETFNEDAMISSKVLGITLTQRSSKEKNSPQMAGFPHHSLETYLHKLVKAGYRVAICDQLEDPKEAKGIVKRGVTEVVTPGVALNDKLLDRSSNNFLCALYLTESTHGISFLDISTGECFIAEGSTEYIDKLLQSFQPSEILISRSKKAFFQEHLDQKYYIFTLEDWIFEYHYGYETLVRHFETQSLKGFGIEDRKYGVTAAGAALHYLKDTQHDQIQHIRSIQQVIEHDFLWMDRFTIRNLELLQSQYAEGTSLLEVIDQTITGMGARLLKRWLLFPLNDIKAIEQRHHKVAHLKDSPALLESSRDLLKQIGDLERLSAKIPLKRANPRELILLKNTLLRFDDLIAIIEDSKMENKQDFLTEFKKLKENNLPVVSLIEKYLKEDAPVALNKGPVIKKGFHKELDDLRSIYYESKEYLQSLQDREIEKTGIPSLKIGFNNVFGYYLEVTNTHKDKVPEEWIRKQTLTSAERYITPELKEYEEKILGAEDKIAFWEQKLFNELNDELIPFLVNIQQTAQAIAVYDCIAGLTYLAIDRDYTRPQMTIDKILDIKDGRHPVIEANLALGDSYIKNDTLLDPDSQQIIILTGPNMSGKSALLRQTALICLLAHMGSFIPASSATIGLTDKIFTRVGASDNLSGGESTFMVEMNETASIINNLSDRSLIILDEIGRGTSTYDGISLAWSIVEFLQAHPTRPKTLFATHYHELNELEEQFDRVKNFHISHKETDQKVIFLRKLTPGGSTHSFGIQVAKMAGMPVDLTDRAMEILGLLESKGSQEENKSKIKSVATQSFQLNIYEGLGEDLEKIKDHLTHVEIDTLTPVEALMKLHELKQIIKHYE